MSFLKPVDMSKVGVVGLRSDREAILSALHDLGVVQVEPVGKEALKFLEPERASDLQRLVGEQLVRFRGLKSALPPVAVAAPRTYANLADVFAAAKMVPIDDGVGLLRRREDAAITRKKSLADTIRLVQNYAFYPGRFEYLHGPRLLSFFGEAKPAVYDRLRAELPALSDAQYFHQREGKVVRFILVVRIEQAEAVGRLAQQKGVTLTAAPREVVGTAAEELPRLESAHKAVEAELAAIHDQLRAISQEWYGAVAALEEAFAIEARKLDVYVKLGTSAETFTLEGWAPKRSRLALETAVETASGGRAVIYSAESHEEPPTLMENPKGVRWFEFFIRFYSIPQSNEFDPTWIFAIAFSLFVGFMIADWGFGLVIFLVCLWMALDFPGRRRLPNFFKNVPKAIMGPEGMRQLAFTLLPGAALAIALGLYANAFFGGPLLNPNVYRGVDLVNNVSFLLGIALIFGLAMVGLGFLLGAIHEYYLHHRRQMLGKIGGIIAAIGVFGIFAPILASGVGVAPSGGDWIWVFFGLFGGGIALLVIGEGPMMGGIGALETLTHLLSYARLVGILLAAIVLAAFIVDSGRSLLSGGPADAAIGIVLLVVGLGFCVIISVFEPSIQGARLLFVEHFSKYYEGNGHPFAPFGTNRVHTTAASAVVGEPVPDRPAVL